MSVCPVCHGNKQDKWQLCSACHERYGRRREDWPDWLRFLVCDWEREDYQFLVVSDVSEDWMIPDPPMVTRDDRDTVLLPAPEPFEGFDLIPYAPYEQDDDNKRYRRANGITDK